MKSVVTIINLMLLSILLSCKPVNKNSEEETQKLIEQEVIGLSQIEVGPYHSFSSTPQVDNTAGGACVSYQFSFKLNSEKSVENFSLTTNFLEKTCQFRMSEMILIGSGKFANDQTKLLDSTLSDALMTSFHDAFTMALNKDASCGFTDWITNRRKSILQSRCIGSPNGRLYFGLKNSVLVLYSCNENQDVSASCKRIVLKRMN